MIIWILLVVLVAGPALGEPVLNGFDVGDASVSVVSGMPVRDGIRSVDSPTFAPAAEASWVASDTQVIGIEIGGVARAYPVHLMEYHQIVNDDFAGRPVAVTYGPLSGTPVAYDASVGGERLEFGVSGLIHESNFLMYDRSGEGLWSQFLGQAVTGPKMGTKLARIRLRQEAFAVWLGRHPETTVLERPLPKRIDYRYSPFQDYWISDKVPFPVSTKDDRFHPKAGVLGVMVDAKARAYLGPVVTAAGGRIVDDFHGHRVLIAYDVEASSFSWEVPDEVQVSDAYWFSWKTFHPDTEVWQAEAEPTKAGD